MCVCDFFFFFFFFLLLLHFAIKHYKIQSNFSRAAHMVEICVPSFPIFVIYYSIKQFRQLLDTANKQITKACTTTIVTPNMTALTGQMSVGRPIILQLRAKLSMWFFMWSIRNSKSSGR